MCKTRAWWYVLANSRPGAFIHRLATTRHDHERGLTVGDYVLKFSQGPDCHRAFRLLKEDGLSKARGSGGGMIDC